MPRQFNVLMTGSAGRVGQALVHSLGGRFRIRGFDRAHTPGLKDAVVGDVGDLDALVEVAHGMDAFVHLGAAGSHAPWEEILRSNIIGTYNAYEAAIRAGIQRFVFPSRAALLKGYPESITRQIDFLPLPDSYYSVSKSFGESLGYLYSTEHGLEVVAIRIGLFKPSQPVPTHAHHLGRRDLVRVFEQALTHPNVKFEIVFGVSDSTQPLYDLDHGRRVLSFHPTQKSTWSRFRIVRGLQRLWR